VATERDPLTPKSRATGTRYSTNTHNYHGHIVRGRWVYCGCMPGQRWHHGPPNSLGPKMRKYDRWAGR
jgi:hypothetical protein